jgi:hypothetical protein
MSTPFLATPPLSPTGPITDPGVKGVLRLQIVISRQANILDKLVHEMFRPIKVNGRAAIEAELGVNSAELELLYDSLKTTAELLGCEDLPELPAL